jgi:putative methyltransferase (TIGR04325 family)
MIANRWKLCLKDLAPPLLIKLVKGRKYGYFGNYQSWEVAKRETTGYDTGIILEKVKSSLLKVKQGEAVYERDSVLFDQIQYSFPLLAGLLRIATKNQGNLSVLDFGGSLGSSYYQCKNFLSVVGNLTWSIVEQKHFIECGKEFFEDEHLKFFYSIEDCLRSQNPDVLLLSVVVQYLEQPYSFLEQVIGYNFQHIIVDRTPFILQGGDRLTIQKVPPEIYPASYPAWFFDHDRFLQIFQRNYKLIAQFEALAGVIQIKQPSTEAIDLGFLFEKIDGILV